MIASRVSAAGVARWRAITDPVAFGIIAEAAGFGLRCRARVACGPVPSRPIDRCTRSERAFTDPEGAGIEAIVLCLHAMTEPPTA